MAKVMQLADPRFTYALKLVERGMGMVEPDGEDSAGRMKWRERPVEAIVKRAFDLAEAAYREAEDRSLLIDA